MTRHFKRPGDMLGRSNLDNVTDKGTLPVITKANLLLRAVSATDQGRLFYVSDGTAGHVAVCNGTGYEYLGGTTAVT